VSGTGIVAWLVSFPDGSTVVRWCVPGRPGSTVVYRSLTDAMDIHGHGGKTRIVWVPQPDVVRVLVDTSQARAAYDSYRRELKAAAGQPAHLAWVASALAAAAYIPQVVDAYEGLAAELARVQAAHDDVAEQLRQVRAELDLAYAAMEATADATTTAGGG
jgi:hypothetical protein